MRRASASHSSPRILQMAKASPASASSRCRKREGTVGAQARSLGAAAIPLSQRYLLDQNAAQRDA
jgi:hypothetical protein